MPASRSKTCRASISEPNRSASGSAASAASSASARHRKEGTEFSSIFFSRAGTPALRKYFCARTSVATWLQAAGTSNASRRKTTEPSGLRISLVAVRKRPSRKATDPWLCSDVQSAFLPRSILQQPGRALRPPILTPDSPSGAPICLVRRPDSASSPRRPNFLHIEINEGLRTTFCVFWHRNPPRRPSARSAPRHSRTLDFRRRRHDSWRQVWRLRASRGKGSSLDNLSTRLLCGRGPGSVRRGESGENLGVPGGRTAMRLTRARRNDRRSCTSFFALCMTAGFAPAGNRL